MAFQFSLNALLIKNKNLRDEARREFAEAQSLHNEIILDIEQMQDLVHRTHINMGDTRSHGGSIAATLEASTEFLAGQKIKIERRLKEAQNQLEQVEVCRQAMVEADREYRKIEVLRDKRLKEYREKEKKRKAKQLDDIIVIRSGYERGAK